MAYSILELINQQMPEVNAAIDLTLSRPSSGGGTYQDGMPDPALDPYFPERGYLSKEACFLRFKKYTPTLAYLRGVDGEVPMDRETLDLNLDRTGSLKITKGQVWTESDFEMIRQIQMMRGLSGGAAAAQELIDVLTSTPVKLTMSWMATLRMLCQRVSVVGKALYTDDMTSIPVELDYTSRIPSGHIATTKTGTARWSQSAGDAIADLVAHLNAVYANVRRFPDVIAMSGTEADNMRNQSTTKIKVARFKGVITDGAVIADASNLPRPTLEEVRQVIASELTSSAQSQGAAPQVVVTDAIYYVRTKANAINSAPYLPSGYYSFHWLSNPIEAARFPVATNNFSSGLAVVTDSEKLPRKEWIAIDGGAIPIVADPRYIAARNVENTPLT